MHGRIFDEDKITALIFHGMEHGGSYREGRWFVGTKKLPAEEFIREVEKKIPIDAVVSCNFSSEDIQRPDLCYIVQNFLTVFNFKNINNSEGVREGSGLDIGFYPELKGCGYFSIRGKQYPIPSFLEAAENWAKSGAEQRIVW